MRTTRLLPSVAIFAGFLLRPGWAQDGAKVWKDVRTTQVGNLEVTLSEPVLVARRSGFLWFPTIMQLASGELLAVMSNYRDAHVQDSTAAMCWSHDRGLTWSAPTTGLYSDSSVRLPDGAQLLLPYYLRPRPGGALGAAYQFIPKGEREARVVEPGIEVRGWPRPDRALAPELGLAGFVFNGNTIAIPGGYLATLYGYFQVTNRYSLVAAESRDGVVWTIRSTVADENCPLPGGEGPCESALCRVRDGRLMCIFRLASNVPFGQTFSSDDGRTWSPPQAIPGVMSVQPALAALECGPILLTGGRPGLYAWINEDGTGRDWQSLDLAAHHNGRRPEDPIANPATGTSAYTELLPLDATHALCIYDRLARGWNAIPEGANETNSVWVVRLTVKPPAKP